MGLKEWCKLSGLALVFFGLIEAQEDSLRSALNAVDRRQKDLSQYSRYDDDSFGDYGYSLDGPDDLAFLPQPDSDYLEEGYAGVKKRISSAFRERLEEDKEHQLEELAESYLANSELERDDEDYGDAVREIWDKYQNYPSLYNSPRVMLNSELRKQNYYPKLRLDSVGLRKRNKHHDQIDESPYMYAYNPRYQDDYFSRYSLDEADQMSDYDINKNRQFKRKYDPRLENYNNRRYAMSKRSSPYSSPVTHEHKRSTTKKDSTKTDPKVAKDLGNVFGASTSTTSTTTTERSKPTKKTTINKQAKKKTDDKKPANVKEVATTSASEKPLQIQKKSINWSDYFGLDRRKKSENEIDNEWLMERYHKAVAIPVKRNVDYPLQSFKNHDQPARNAKLNKKDKNDDVKIAEIDGKLKNMEDAIIDDALKYTGAHEGTIDSLEIQEVKDRVISRLAAAYSLEKMRRALGEYKTSIAKERDRLRQEENRNFNEEDYDMAEEKRVAVPRKQAIDNEKNKADGDNKIKCTQGEDCDEQKYNVPHDNLKNDNFEECPRIQRACNQIAELFGNREVFARACNMHQMCLLCSNNSWFAPTRQCNVLFLTKAFELCEGNEECQKEAQKSVKYLLEVNRSLRAEPMGECELACPDRR